MKERKRQYIIYDPNAGHPAGDNCFYECLICGDVLPSRPKDDVDCKCKNIIIDVGAHRLVLRDHSKTKFFCIQEQE